MHKLMTLAVAGLAAGWLMMATPADARAQGGHYGGSPYRGQAYPAPGGYVPGGYVPGGYVPGGYNQGYQNGYRGQGYYGPSYPSRPPVVHPQYEHWTPGRGWHEHGHIHVPHGGHSHTRPY